MRVFRQKSTLEDAIGFHAFAPLEALLCVWSMTFLSGVHCLLPVDTVHSVATLKAKAALTASLTLTLTLNSAQTLKAKAICEKHNVLLIADEVQTGTVLFPPYQPTPPSNRVEWDEVQTGTTPFTFLPP
jgi:hypothetical protein